MGKTIETLKIGQCESCKIPVPIPVPSIVQGLQTWHLNHADATSMDGSRAPGEQEKTFVRGADAILDLVGETFSFVSCGNCLDWRGLHIASG